MFVYITAKHYLLLPARPAVQQLFREEEKFGAEVIYCIASLYFV